MNRRHALSSKKATPKPSAWWSVTPPRAANPVNENVTSVGSAQFMPSSWHMVGKKSDAIK